MGAPEPLPCLLCELLRSGTLDPQGMFCAFSRRAERKRAAKGPALCTLFLSNVIAELRALLTVLIQSSILLVFTKNLA